MPADWQNLDVTPVGRAPGAAPPGQQGGQRSGGSDPFGSLPTERRPGWVRIALGAAALLAGLVALVWGIADTVQARERIESDAVGGGTVEYHGGELGPAVSFEAPPGGPHEYSVWLLFGSNVVNRELEEEAAVQDSGCVAQLGRDREVPVERSGITTIGRASALGSFEAPPGAVRVRCAYGPGTFRSRRRRPDSVRYVVTPGSVGSFGRGIGLIVGGVFVAVGGGFLVGWGWRRRRRVVAG